MSITNINAPRNGKRPETLAARLVRQYSVTDAGCWEWSGQRRPSGYGVTSWNGKHVRAHRASFTVFKGDIPLGILVLHSCDNRCCINPEHLFLGTGFDNMKDMVMKGRGASCLDAARKNPPRGSAHGHAVLTESLVLEIRELRRQDVTIKAISERFGVSQSAVQSAAVGNAWSHIPGAVPKKFTRPRKPSNQQISELLCIEHQPAEVTT